jgi:hypothetical protein
VIDDVTRTRAGGLSGGRAWVLTLEFAPGRGGTVDTVRIGGEGQQRQEEQSEETGHTFESVAARWLFSYATVRTVLCRDSAWKKSGILFFVACR